MKLLRLLVAVASLLSVGAAQWPEIGEDPERIEVRPVIRGEIAGLGGGEFGGFIVPEVRLLEIEGGVRIGRQVGVMLGTTLLGSNYILTSILPVRARGFLDLNPDARWVRQTSYVTLSWHPYLLWGDDRGAGGISAGIGTNLTWYCFMPEIEAGLIKAFDDSPLMTYVMLRVGLGGTYVLGHSAGSGSEQPED